jgi:hypothetical protein
MQKFGLTKCEGDIQYDIVMSIIKEQVREFCWLSVVD